MNHRMKRLVAQVVSLMILTVAGGAVAAAPARKPLYRVDPVLARGLRYLLSHQGPHGAWMPQVGPAVTALVIRALIRAGYPADDPHVVRALSYIESTRQADGGFYVHGMLQNYNTSIVLSMLTVLPRTRYQAQIRAAQRYLMSLQHVAGQKNSQGRVITKNSSWYGGVGYGHDRPDLSNTSFFIAALHDSGIPPTNPALRRALVFVTRCQENSETNPLPWARGTHNGGFIYTPVNGGGSSFGNHDTLRGARTARGDLPYRWTAYGTMTYSGLKSMVYCGLTKNDPRVKAAIRWIRGHWTLKSNPGTGGSRMGLFYYYLMFGRALHALGVKTITDVDGIRHHWRPELHRQLASLQLKSGAWKNLWAKRWLEGHRDLVTAYSCLALENADRQ